LGVEIKKPEPVQEPEPEPELEKLWTVDRDQVFRFMDLPGGELPRSILSYSPCHIFPCPYLNLQPTSPELRNRIYEYAADYSHSHFPHTYAKPAKRRSKRLPLTPDQEDRRPPLQPLPYIGLSQSCTQIRTEFRPLWLSTHRFPLSVVPSYIQVFFPTPLQPSRTTDVVRKRIAGYADPVGSLRIWVTKESLIDIDIRQLLRHLIRFPVFTFTLAPLNVDPGIVAQIELLLNNKSKKWTNMLSRNAITQVRLRKESPRYNKPLHVVVKELYAEDWMRKVGMRYHGAWLAGVGMSGIGWSVSFGVDYS
jgi:hypothetical protein